jgi:hypothetical protein
MSPLLLSVMHLMDLDILDKMFQLSFSCCLLLGRFTAWAISRDGQREVQLLVTLFEFYSGETYVSIRVSDLQFGFHRHQSSS